jgi:signal transduction histidine kinase
MRASQPGMSSEGKYDASRGTQQEELRTNARLLELIYDSTSDPVYLARVEPGGQYRFISVNESFLRVSGYQVGETALREADQRKNEFLGVLSHELRNPLTPILNSLYILRRATPGGEQARRAQMVIERQVNHLMRLVDDLLDLTRHRTWAAGGGGCLSSKTTSMRPRASERS